MSMVNPNEDWEVVKVEWVDMDKHYKAVVAKKGNTKVVYFPCKVSVGQIVSLNRV